MTVTGQQPKDENEKLKAGTLPDDPAADARPMKADTSVRESTVRLVTENVDASKLPLPSDVHAEAQLLSTLLWCGNRGGSPLSVSDVQDLLETPDRLFSPAHQAIYKAMLTEHASMRVTSVVNVNSRLVKSREIKLAGGIVYLEQLASNATPTSGQTLRDYASSIRDAWGRRELIAMANALSADAKLGKQKSEAIVERSHTGLVNIASLLSASSAYLSFAQVASDVMKKVGSGATDALPTGLADLDDMTGGWYPQEVTIIAARTSVGKSALATQFAFDAVTSRPNDAVLYVSLEMPARQFVARILASRSGVSLRRIRRNQATKEDLVKMRAAEEAMRSTRVYFVDSQLQTIMSISTIASRLNSTLMRGGSRLALIVVDHLGLVKPSAESMKKQREQQVAETSRGLKYLAQHHKCHVMGLAQIGRDAEKQQGKSKVPQLFHIRESGSIEQDAENILIIHRPRDAQGHFKENSPAILNVAKARNDGLGHVWLAFEEETGRFRPWQDSDAAKARAPNGRNRPDIAPPGTDDGLPSDCDEEND